MISRHETGVTSLPEAQEQGFSLLEVMVSIGLFAVMASAISGSLTTAMRVAKLTEIHFVASSLAAGKIEELSSVDPLDLDSSDNQTESAVVVDGYNMSFTRTTAITINADNSRTITVNVSSNNPGLPNNVNFSTTFALWE